MIETTIDSGDSVSAHLCTEFDVELSPLGILKAC